MRTFEGPRETIVIWQSFEVANELARLGLSQDKLHEAVRRGEVARDGCTSNHPRCYPGMRAWAETICGLRDIYGPLEWAALDLENFPLTVSPGSDFAIAVEMGDEKTGHRQFSPKTKYEMGPVVFAFIEQNRQMSLWRDNSKGPLPPPVDAPTQLVTWILLRHRNDNEVRIELSLPVLIDTDKRIYRWAVRILLAPLPIDPEPARKFEDDGDEIDIDVTRKSA